MTVRYVRKTGSDSNAGTSAGVAWLTIDHAVGSSASGDTIYVGGGTYREIVSSWIAASVETSLIGDTDGSHTGDSGEVVITAFLTNDKTAPSTSPTLNDAAGATSLTYWTLQGLTVVGGAVGGSNASCLYTANPVTNLTIRDCTFWGYGNSLYVVFVDNLADSASAHILFERNRLFGANSCLYWGYISTSGTGDVDLDIVTRNCILWGGSEAARMEGSANVKPGGWIWKNNYFITRRATGAGLNAVAGALSTAFPQLVYNNVFYMGTIQANATTQVTEDYNFFYGFTSNTLVTAGTHSKFNTYDMRFLFGQEQSYGATLRPFGMPPTGSPLLGYGAFDSSVTDDILQGPRPGSGIGSVLQAVGPFERGNSGTKSTTVTHTAPQSLQFNGPGYQDFELSVASGAQTISIWVLFDATYAGTLPQLKILNGGECGVADASVTATGSANTWSQISLSPSPTAAGIVTVRFQSNDTNGAGQTYFADYTGP